MRKSVRLAVRPSDYHFVAMLNALDQLRELSLGFMDIYGLRLGHHDDYSLVP
jgi:hypothetical protein